jgi:hypothetical protein
MRVVDVLVLLAVVAATAWVICAVARRRSRLLRAEREAIWEPYTDENWMSGHTSVGIERVARLGKLRWSVEHEVVLSVPPGPLQPLETVTAEGEAIAQARDRNEREGRSES